MADIKALKSYLVSLGFAVNNTQLTQFNNAIKSATQLVENSCNTQIAMFAKATAAGVGFFTALGAAAVATADKVAMADQEFRLFGERMFMDTQHARALKMTMDALGQSDLAALAFDPELNRRAERLINLQATLSKQLGPNFEGTMEKIRDVRAEFSAFSIEVQYFIMNVVGQVFQALGGESFIDRLRALNAYVVEHIPEWSRYFTTLIVPILKDVWMIVKDIWEIMVDLATVFDNFMGIITGDSTVMGAANFEKFAKSVEKAVHIVAILLHLILKLFGTLTGAAIGFTLGGPMGAVIGGAAGAGFDLVRGLSRASTPEQMALGGDTGGAGGAGGTLGTASFAMGGNETNDVRSLAQQVGARLGIPPEIIFGQWMHETGNLSNRGARQLNNLAGIRLPGSTEYRHFASLQDFGNYYTGLIERRYPGAMGQTSPEGFAGALKHGGYFEDRLSTYTRGIRSGMSRYGDVSIGSINIMQPNATPEQIAQHVSKAIQERQQVDSSYNIAQVGAAY